MNRHAAIENRRISREVGLRFYTGTTCSIYPSHGGKRYTSSGNCIRCQALKQNKTFKGRPRPSREMITEPYTEEQEARLQSGALKYYGQPCKAGHDGLRYARNATCVDCAAERSRQHRPPTGMTKTERWKWKHARRLAHHEAVRQILREAPPLDEPHPLLWFILAV